MIEHLEALNDRLLERGPYLRERAAGARGVLAGEKSPSARVRSAP